MDQAGFGFRVQELERRDAERLRLVATKYWRPEAGPEMQSNNVMSRFKQQGRKTLMASKTIGHEP
jgi:hypothetical protein